MSDTLPKLLLLNPDVQDVQLPLLLDAHEEALVPPPQPTCSTLLVGRSGTGKTSLCNELLYRTHAANERRRVAEQRVAEGAPARLEAEGEDAPPHANVLFLCKSRTLASRIESHHAGLVAPLGAQPPPAARLKEAFVAAEPELDAPLFLSSSEWLVLLDRCLPPDQRWFKSDQEEARFLSATDGGGDSLAPLLAPAEPSSPRDLANGRGEAGAAGAARRAKRASGAGERSLLTFEGFGRLLQGHSSFKDKQLHVGALYREVSLPQATPLSPPTPSPPCPPSPIATTILAAGAPFGTATVAT